MDRFVLINVEWAKMQPHCLSKPTDPGGSWTDNRRFVEAILWIARTGVNLNSLPCAAALRPAAICANVISG
jgi:hypothetical protein